VSGAGDTVIGVLALMVAAGADLHDAMRVANHAAGHRRRQARHGGRPSEELEKSLATTH
jgi:bifunctional ADP-heptose synthase (sugar kinase/adenylyltransferase)